MSVSPFAFLQTTEHLYVRQKIEMLEIFTGFETNNRYEIINDAGQVIMYAMEDTDLLSRWFCAARRPFTINILSAYGPCLMKLMADMDYCGQHVEIEIPPGKPFARIEQEFALCTPSFYVTNAETGQQVFQIHSDYAARFGSFGTVDFNIKGTDGVSTVGRISKHWRGLAMEMFTDADNFGVSMPKDMAVEWKAVILAITFHIDMTFYEQNHSRARGRRGFG